MRVVLLFALVVAVAAAGFTAPLSLVVAAEGDAVNLAVRLEQPLPPSFTAALPSGAVVRLTYNLLVRSMRRGWWDRKLWHGRMVVAAVYDPVIGRYRLESILDDVIVASREAVTADEATSWLVAPPAVRLALREPLPSWDTLVVRARAEFADDTVWLVFPVTDATAWVEQRLAAVATPPADGPTRP